MYEQLVELLSTKLGVPTEETAPDATFADLEIDSLALVELSDVLEGQYGLALEEGQVTKETTLSDAAERLAREAGQQ
jgi:acyl carrier protein